MYSYNTLQNHTDHKFIQLERFTTFVFFLEIGIGFASKT